MELSLIRKLSHVYEAQEVPFQFVHLVYYIGIQGKHLKKIKIRDISSYNVWRAMQKGVLDANVPDRRI